MSDITKIVLSFLGYAVLFSWAVCMLAEPADASEYISNFDILNLYPNPFNPSVNIHVKIPSIAPNASVDVYDINGKFIDKIYSGYLNPGYHSFVWTPNQVASGKYFIKLKSGNFIKVKEAVYIK